MPSPEGELPPQQPDQDKSPEEPHGYYQAARFLNAQLAGRAYFRVQRILYGQEMTDLSVFRFELEGVPHVAVLGKRPLPDLGRRLRNILAAGLPRTLPSEILAMLHERRSDATQLGSWVERHYRPGKRIDL